MGTFIDNLKEVHDAYIKGQDPKVNGAKVIRPLYRLEAYRIIADVYETIAKIREEYPNITNDNLMLVVNSRKGGE